MSTPQVDATTRSPANPFHRVEFSRADFERLLRGRFRSVQLYGQRRVQSSRHRALQRLDVLGLRKRLPFLRHAAPLVGTRATVDATLDDFEIRWIRSSAVCRRCLAFWAPWRCDRAGTAPSARREPRRP